MDVFVTEDLIEIEGLLESLKLERDSEMVAKKNRGRLIERF